VLVDTHLHLLEVDSWRDAADEAAAAGVSALLTMGHDLASSARALEAAAELETVWAGCGQHASGDADGDLEAFGELFSDPNCVAVGEVGLDENVAPPYAPAAEQRRRFAAMCTLAVEYDLPVSVHVRGTEAAVLDELRRHPGLAGVMHYFSLGWDWAERFLDLGMHISFSGLVTRPSREELREVARRCPADRLLLETDAPYGTPHGRPGPNRPAHLLDTARCVAELRGLSLEELATLEGHNARALFKRLPPPPAGS
jgi:TatD DNase family protein